MSKFKQALLNPVNVYAFPMEVVQDNELTREQKIQILHRWEYDAHELAVAEEENMPELTTNESGTMLSRVLEALHALGSSAAQH